MTLSLSSTVRLNDGREMPRMGLGVYQVPTGQTTLDAVAAALKVGYRHIDTARLYRNEASVGEAIRASGVSPGSIWVTTKLWPTDWFHVQAAFDKSMERLGLEHVDLYLLHFPLPGRIKAIWRSMEAIAASGRARSIGVSNFSARQLGSLLAHASTPPAVNQVRASVFWWKRDTYELCQREHVAFEAYSPLNRGKRLDDSTVRAVAARHGKSPAQVLLRWGLQKDMIVIPKSERPDRIAENANVYDFELDEADMRSLDALAS